MRSSPGPLLPDATVPGGFEIKGSQPFEGHSLGPRAGFPAPIMGSTVRPVCMGQDSMVGTVTSLGRFTSGIRCAKGLWLLGGL